MISIIQNRSIRTFLQDSSIISTTVLFWDDGSSFFHSHSLSLNTSPPLRNLHQKSRQYLRLYNKWAMPRLYLPYDPLYPTLRHHLILRLRQDSIILRRPHIRYAALIRWICVPDSSQRLLPSFEGVTTELGFKLRKESGGDVIVEVLGCFRGSD